MDTTNDQDAALEKLAEAAKKAAEKVAEKAAENRREPSPPTSRLEGELDPTNDQEKDGTSNSAAPPSPPTNTFWDMSHQQCSDTLHTQNSAEPCFRSGAYDPMIGGRELHALISEQNSIDQTLDGGLGGMEDDEDFLQFVTRAQLIRRRTGIAPRMNADVQDVVRYTDQRYTGEGTATGDWLPQPHCWRHAKTTVRGFRDVSEG